MSSLGVDIQEARAQSVSLSDEALSVDLVDGRTVIVPLLWFPRLWYGSKEERKNASPIRATISRMLSKSDESKSSSIMAASAHDTISSKPKR